MAFRQNKRGTLLVSVTTTQQSIALPSGGGGLLRIQNLGGAAAGAAAYVEVGPSGIEAQAPTSSSGGGLAVRANLPAEFVQLRAGDANVALVGSANCTVAISRGDLV